MYFYVDESGHTGLNLFDAAQPMLYYGVLSSRMNLDVVAEYKLASLRRRLKVLRLHAAELGTAGGGQVSPGGDCAGNRGRPASRAGAIQADCGRS